MTLGRRNKQKVKYEMMEEKKKNKRGEIGGKWS